MKTLWHTVKHCVATLGAALLITQGTQAAGLMSPASGNLPQLEIRQHHVDVNIEDGYAITTGRTQEYVQGSLAVVRVDRAMGKSLQRFRTDVSDHLPLAATFRIDTDDD